MLTDRINNITYSKAMKIAGNVIELKNKGVDVVDFTAGQPDFPTPDNIKAAAFEAITQNKTRYTKNPGLTELREAVINKFKHDNDLHYAENEVMVSTGAKQCLFNAILSLVSKDDEVIFQSPYYTSYPHMISLAEGKSVEIKTTDKSNFKITKSMLENVITEKSKVFILCNPSNPTGAVYSKSELEELAEVVIENNLYVVTDEIYEKIVYDQNKFVSFASLSSEIKERIVVVNGVSKAYSMTGWRIGYCAANKEIISAMNKIQSHSTSGANSIAQCASVEALNGDQSSVESMRNEYQKRRDFIFEKLNEIDGLSVSKCQGAFYLFINIEKLIDKKEIKSANDFTDYLLNEFNVAAIPGTVFGTDGYMRISFATSMDTLEKGVERIKHAVESLS